MKKEFIVFLGVPLFLTIAMLFSEWTSHPIEHFMALPDSGAYGLGMIHPLIFTLFFYIIFVIIRAFIRTFTKKA